MIYNIFTFKLLFSTDYYINEYVIPQELPLSAKLNGRKSTLKLISTLQIIKMLKYSDCDTDCDCDPTKHLPLPLLIRQEILQEYKYQTELYFTIVLEPSIMYTYPNEY